MSHNNLGNYYKVLHSLKPHGYLIDEVENLMPFERDLYIDMITKELKKQEQEALKQGFNNF